MIFIENTVRVKGEELHIINEALKLTLKLAVMQAEEGHKFDDGEIAVQMRIVEMLADLEDSKILED